MDFSYLDKDEYRDIFLVKIEDNKNDLPFCISLCNVCNQEMHRHAFVQINYMLRGRLKHVINQNVFDVYKGDIFVIPPYVPHRFIDEQRESFQLVELEFVPDFISESFSRNTDDSGFMDFAYLEPFLVAENMVKPRLNLSGALMEEVESILAGIQREYKQREPDFVIAIKARLLQLLVLVGREFRKGGREEYQGVLERHRNALHATLAYISENFAEDVSAESAAKMAMVSASYFRYLFKQMTGKSFVEYLRALRVAKAVDLLKSKPDMKVIDVCFEVGYQNVNHFNRIFRQETGLSPVEVRKSRMREPGEIPQPLR